MIECFEHIGIRLGEWDKFAEENGTMFHAKKFLSYHGEDKFNWHHLEFRKGDKLFAILPAAIIGDSLVSPAGASYGGFVFEKCSVEEADQCVKAVVRHCSKIGIKEIRITPPMQIYNRDFDEVQEYALLHNRFQQIGTQYSSIIPVQCAQLDKGRRSDIRRAERDGLEIKESKDFNLLYPILVENKMKYDTCPVHSVEEMEHIDGVFDTKLFLAYVDKVPIAGLWILPVSRKCALIFYSAHRYEYRKHNGIVCLVAHAIEWARESGYEWLDYGVSTSTEDPNEVQASLVKFKERLGGHGCLRKTFLRKIL